ncbi:MAG: tRNA (adenosine(37)-N6)-threonylcarbamoyltransferase complex dimerization subunit type 1 TsaB [Candidatus Margulisbacteria bacterium]|nr:tRNA (adenosine(37)-N6)-threonylcarbamoyltransferase complex dimerization subunit type 1 TsaB [Candidatus Margulisiibacteriota bacterium]
MKILGINTATTNLSYALIDEDKIIFEEFFNGPTVQAEQLIPWISESLKKTKLSIKDINGVGVAQGPGAFTGLRIGVTTAKTLAQMLNIPLAGISTIEAFAFQFIENKKIKLLRVLLNACRGEINTGLFSISNQKLKQIEKDHPEKIDTLLKTIPEEKSVLAGDIPQELNAHKIEGAPGSISIAKLALQKIKNNENTDPKILVPIYSHGPNIRLSPRIHSNLIKQNGNK